MAGIFCLLGVCRNKYLLLNSQELNELSAISMKANIPEVEALVNTDRSLVCDGKKGLLTRILTVMKREPPDSSFRLELRQTARSVLLSCGLFFPFFLSPLGCRAKLPSRCQMPDADKLCCGTRRSLAICFVLKISSFDFCF